MDEFEKDMLILGVQRANPTYESQNMFGNPVSIQTGQTHHSGSIYRVLSTEPLPFIMTELLWNNLNVCIGKRELINVNEVRFRRISEENLQMLKDQRLKLLDELGFYDKKK